MTTSPILDLPDFTTDFVVETNASGTRIGVVLMQSGRPIVFLSKAYCPKNLSRFVYLRERISCCVDSHSKVVVLFTRA